MAAVVSRFTRVWGSPCVLFNCSAVTTPPSPKMTATSGRSVRLGLMSLESREVPAVFTVTNTNDSGTGSLRAAILAANAASGADTIEFQRATFRGPTVSTQSITLSGELEITDFLTIKGPGAPLLVLDGNASGRIFNILGDINMKPTVTIEGLGMTGGSGVAEGAAIYAEFVTLTIKNSDLFGNTTDADGSGGAIFADELLTDILIDNSRIAENSASLGGGVAVTGSATLRIRNSTLSNNVADAGTTFNGAAMYYDSDNTLRIYNSTIYGNAGSTAVFIRTAAVPEVISSIVSDTSTSFSNEDIDSDVDVLLQYSAVGDSSGFSLDASSSNNLSFGTSLQLNAEAAIGGPFETFEPGSSSPLLNVGLDISSTGFDQRGVSYVRTSGSDPDIGAIERQSSVVPEYDTDEIEVNVVNGGGIQRSRVLDVDVYFANFYVNSTFTGTGNITLTNANSVVVQTGATGANGRVNVTSQIMQSNSIRLYFDNANSSNVTSGVEYTSLADGRWDLVVAGASAPTDIIRLFGDSNGDATVDGVDITNYGNAFGTSLYYFDWNMDGTVDGTDGVQVGNRFGLTV
jgi:hypothetical protein